MTILRKLAVTGGLVALIGTLVVHLGTGEYVSESRADILDLSGAVDGEKAFRQVLDDMGHHEPKTYVVNGNQVRMSTATLEMSPRPALARYQKAFVERGLNERAFTDLSSLDAMARNRVALTGGLAPTIVSSDRVVMRGVRTRGNPSGYTELLETRFDRTDASAMSELFEGFRWVELHRLPGGGGSKAVALWSGKEFDYDRMFPDELERRARRADAAFPPCPNCVLTNQFSDPEHPRTSTSLVYLTKRSPRSMQQFYANHCGTGRYNEPSQWLDRLRSRIDFPGGNIRRVGCRVDGQHVDIKIHPTDNDRTAVRMEHTSAPPESGGSETATSPFDLFDEG